MVAAHLRSPEEIAAAWVRLKGGDSEERDDVFERVIKLTTGHPGSALAEASPEDIEGAGQALIRRKSTDFTLLDWAYEVLAWSQYAPPARKLTRALAAVDMVSDSLRSDYPSAAEDLLVARWVQRLRDGGQERLLDESDSDDIPLEMHATRLLMRLWMLDRHEATEGLFSVSPADYPGRKGPQAYVAKERRYTPPQDRDSTKWVDRLTVPMDFAIRCVSKHRSFGGQFWITDCRVICRPCEAPLASLDGLIEYPTATKRCVRDGRS